MSRVEIWLWPLAVTGAMLFHAGLVLLLSGGGVSAAMQPPEPLKIILSAVTSKGSLGVAAQPATTVLPVQSAAAPAAGNDVARPVEQANATAVAPTVSAAPVASPSAAGVAPSVALPQAATALAGPTPTAVAAVANPVATAPQVDTTVSVPSRQTAASPDAPEVSVDVPAVPVVVAAAPAAAATTALAPVPIAMPAAAAPVAAAASGEIATTAGAIAPAALAPAATVPISAEPPGPATGVAPPVAAAAAPVAAAGAGEIGTGASLPVVPAVVGALPTNTAAVAAAAPVAGEVPVPAAAAAVSSETVLLPSAAAPAPIMVIASVPDEAVVLPPVVDDVPTPGALDRFLARYEGGDCFAASAVPGDAPVLAAFAASFVDSVALQLALGETFTDTVTVDSYQVDQRQCGALAFVGALRRASASSVTMVLDSQVVQDGARLSGTLSVPADQFVYLLVVDDEGGVSQVGAYVTGNGDEKSFSIPVNMTGEAAERVQLLVAVSTAAPASALTDGAASAIFETLAAELAGKAVGVAIEGFVLR